jgi:hypothetical protein
MDWWLGSREGTYEVADERFLTAFPIVLTSPGLPHLWMAPSCATFSSYDTSIYRNGAYEHCLCMRGFH